MVYKLRLRSSSRSSFSHYSQALYHQPSNQIGSISQQEPLRSITSAAALNQTPERRIRKSASKMVMDIIDSPRRALANRKKRLIAEKNACLQERPLSSNPTRYVSFPDLVDQENSSMEVDSQIDLMSTNRNVNVLEWLEQDAPQDILPKILCFAGPKMVQTLARVNKSWNSICTSEAVFRTLCEGLGKWTEGMDDEPGANDVNFWKDIYRRNPIVPLDYSSIPKAAASCCNYKSYEGSGYFECYRNVRILVEPGIHYLERELTVETLENAEFSIQNHQLYSNHTAARNTVATGYGSRPSTPNSMISAGSSSDEGSPAPTRRRLNSGFRSILSCRSSSSVDGSDSDISVDCKSAREQATIVLKTKVRNCPVLRIRQGQMNVVGVSLIHYCSGTDIWNGNSAIQIQPRFDEARNRIFVPQAPHKPPTAVVIKCKVTSLSGRGIVAIDGSSVSVKQSHIHRCAATGIYVGGTGSVANIYQTDVVNNGIGNNRSRRGIARGHSGIYVEQGMAVLSDSNISHNALTGVSAISPENAILRISDSDLVGNGTLQLEMPADGTTTWRRSSFTNNNIDKSGSMRTRSGLYVENIDEGIGARGENVVPS